MKLAAATVFALIQQSSAFAPTAFTQSKSNAFTTSTQRSVIVDPSILADAHQHVDTLSNVFSSMMTLSDGDAVADVVDAVADVVASAPAVVDTAPVVQSAAVAAPAAGDVAAVANAADDNGWFGFLEGPIESLLQIIHSSLVSVGLSENSWGVSIIAMTTLIKVLTYPLTAQQLTSTSKMQALQPVIKDIQAKYQSNPEVMNQKIAAVYQDNEVNPLAGCIPSILQIPVFIGLYRAVLTLAKDDKLNEAFLWLPNLEGPTYGADPASASGWLFSGWTDGVPALGWTDTLAFLSIPVILVISQSISMNMMATKDQEQPAFIKFLPLLIGWFSLNVPAALGIYWVANNFITTALTLQIRSGIKPAEVNTGSTGGGATIVEPQSTFTPAPIREKPSGFGANAFEDSDGVKPITPTMDAEIVAEDRIEVNTAMPETGGKKKKKRGGKKKRKKN